VEVFWFFDLVCSMLTLVDYKIALRYLAYLGYYHHNYSGASPYEAIKIIAPSSKNSKKHFNERTVFHGLVLGAVGSGKVFFVSSYLLV
jgi:hypothetical protein